MTENRVRGSVIPFPGVMLPAAADEGAEHGDVPIEVRAELDDMLVEWLGLVRAGKVRQIAIVAEMADGDRPSIYDYKPCADGPSRDLIYATDRMHFHFNRRVAADEDTEAAADDDDGDAA